MEMGTHKRSDFDEKAPWRKFQEIAKETREKRAVLAKMMNFAKFSKGFSKIQREGKKAPWKVAIVAKMANLVKISPRLVKIQTRWQNA